MLSGKKKTGIFATKDKVTNTQKNKMHHEQYVCVWVNLKQKLHCHQTKHWLSSWAVSLRTRRNGSWRQIWMTMPQNTGHSDVAWLRPGFGVFKTRNLGLGFGNPTAACKFRGHWTSAGRRGHLLESPVQCHHRELSWNLGYWLYTASSAWSLPCLDSCNAHQTASK